MSFGYEYSKSVDLVNGLDSNGQILGEPLHSHIESNPAPLDSISHMNGFNDTLTIFFTSEITGTDKTTLDTVISNYVHVIPRGEKSIRIDVNQRNTKGSDWTLIKQFDLHGSEIKTITHIKIISRLNKGSSYDVKIFDDDSDLTIASKNFTNTKTEILDMGTISNVPSTDSVFEIHVKCDSKSSKCSVEAINIFYN